MKSVNMYKVIFIFSLTFCLAIARHEQYNGHSLYKVVVNNEDQARRINGMESHIGMDVWSYANPSRPGMVLVPGSLRKIFEKTVIDIGAQFEVQVENIKEAIEKEEKHLAAAAKRSNQTDGILSFDKIHRYAEVYAYLEELAQKYPTVSVVNAGKSFDGRDIKYLTISTSNFQDSKKPVIMVQSLLHAREWVTLPATLYAIKRLVVEITDRDLVDQIDWIILPIANPDGYEFSHTDARFWRKNRSTGLSICVGVDLNRNFDYKWGTASSGSACSETFHGPHVFSEPESVVIRNIIQRYQSRMELFIDVHSFGSLVLFGYGDGALPPNALSLNVAGVRMATAIDAVKWPSKPNYRVGNLAMALYEMSGGCSDYVQAVGVPLSYLFELPAYRSMTGINGFLVDPDFIEQAGFETWEGIKAGARFVLQNTRKMH